MNTGRALLGGLILILIAALGFFVYRDYLAPPAETPVPTVISPEQQEETAGTISSEGRVEPARHVELGFAQPGRIAEILVQEGDPVRAGDRLMVLDSAALEAARGQAEAGVQAAQANLQAALTRQEQALSAARAADAGEIDAWEVDLPAEIEQPAWYFTRTEEISSTQAEISAANAQLQIELDDLQMVLERATSADLIAAEKRLSDAQAAFLVADEALQSAQDSGDSDLRDQAQTAYDAALSELEAAQDSYDEILDTQGAQDVLEARARVAVARKRYEVAQNRLDELLSGEESLEVRLAGEDVERARAALAEAEAALRSAQTALDEAALLAPMDGIVARLEVEIGEAINPASPPVVLADMESWIVSTTDLAEADAALLETGMPASVTLDAFPDQTFDGTVQSIALWSEDNRGSVTYQVRVSFDPGATPVRWGMTAFVDIALGEE